MTRLRPPASGGAVISRVGLRFPFCLLSGTMIARFWMVVRDDSARTFEVIGKEVNDNRLANRIAAMQRLDMNVSYMSPPVTTQTLTKESIKFAGYVYEPGLYDRLQADFLELTLRQADDE